MFDKFTRLWRYLTTPREADPDNARREYTVRVIIATINMVVIIFSLVCIIIWLAGVVSYDYIVRSLECCLIAGGTLWLTHSGYWRLTGYLPALTTFLFVAYDNYRQGITTGSMVGYIIVVMLVSIMENKWMQWGSLLLCVVTYIGLGIAHTQLNISVETAPFSVWVINLLIAMIVTLVLQMFLSNQLRKMIQKEKEDAVQLAEANTRLMQEMEERQSAEAEQTRLLAEQAALQQEVIEAQQHTLRELSTPIIPVMDQIIVLPLIGHLDSARARDITRVLLKGISDYNARVVIIDITGVPLVDTGVAAYLNKTIRAAQLKGAQTIVTGISDAVAETIVDLGIDWSEITTLSSLQSGLLVALKNLGIKLIDKSILSHTN